MTFYQHYLLLAHLVLIAPHSSGAHLVLIAPCLSCTLGTNTMGLTFVFWLYSYNVILMAVLLQHNMQMMFAYVNGWIYVPFAVLALLHQIEIVLQRQ